MEILCAEYVVPVDKTMTVYSPGAVVVEGKLIKDIGAKSDILTKYTDVKIKDFGASIIMPGCVNTHSHMPMILTRGLGDDRELIDWLNNFVFPLEAQLLSAEYCHDAAIAGSAELLRHGFTSVLDMYYYTDNVAQACVETGIRAWLSCAVVDFPTKEFQTPRHALASTDEGIKRWASDPRINVLVALHSTYTVSPDILMLGKEVANKNNSLIHIHLAESDQELKSVHEKYGKHPVQLLYDLGFMGKEVIAAHCVKLEPEHIAMLKETDMAISHNPCSNLKLASGIAPITELKKQGIRVGLGTDGPMSSNRLDPFHAMDIAAKVQKCVTNEPAVLPASEMIRMATIDGARVLQADDKIGSLEPGKIADLIVVDYARGKFSEIHDVYVHLVYACHGEMVTDVMVDGNWVIQNEEFKTIDIEKICSYEKKWSTKINNIVATL